MIEQAKAQYGDQCTVRVTNGKYVIQTEIPVPPYNWETIQNSYAYLAYNLVNDEYGTEYYRWMEENDRWDELTDYDLVPRYEEEVSQLITDYRKIVYCEIKKDPQGKIAQKYRETFANDELSLLTEEFHEDNLETLTKEDRVLRYEFDWNQFLLLLE